MKLSGIINALQVSEWIAPKVPQAPYHRSGSNLIEDTYLVRFRKGHTLEDHYKFLGRNISENATLFKNLPIIGGYHARLDAYTVHDLIRYDPGVSLVYHDHIIPAGTGIVNSTGTSRRWAKEELLGSQYGSAMISRDQKVNFEDTRNMPRYVSTFVQHLFFLDPWRLKHDLSGLH